MPRYNLECLEKFTVRTYYNDVEADSLKDAKYKVKSGAVAYDDFEIEDGDEEFLSVEDSEMVEDA